MMASCACVAIRALRRVVLWHYVPAFDSETRHKLPKETSESLTSPAGVSL